MMDKLVAGVLRIDVVDTGSQDPILLYWIGRSVDRNPAKFVGPYCANILAVAAQRSVAVEMHFEKLEYFNSSTITAVIQIIHEAKKKNVKLIIFFDATLKWQLVSFDTLGNLFKGNSGFELRPLSPPS